MSVSQVFLPDQRRRVAVIGASSELDPIAFLYILYVYVWDFYLMENKLFTYTDDFTQIAVVRVSADTYLRKVFSACTGSYVE